MQADHFKMAKYIGLSLFNMHGVSAGGYFEVTHLVMQARHWAELQMGGDQKWREEEMRPGNKRHDSTSVQHLCPSTI